MATSPCREGFKDWMATILFRIEESYDTIYLVALLEDPGELWGTRYEDLVLVDAGIPPILGWTLAYTTDRYAPTGLAHEEVEWTNDSGDDQTVVGFALVYNTSGGTGPKVVTYLTLATPITVLDGQTAPVLPLISLQICCD